MSDTEILAYTDSRITELEKENEELKKHIDEIKKYKICPRCTRSDVQKLEKENADLKEQVESLANTNIKAQNIIADLKEQNEAIRQEFIEARYRGEGYIKQIEKMKCCGNCSKRNQCEMNVIDSLHCDKWELAENDRR